MWLEWPELEDGSVVPLQSKYRHVAFYANLMSDIEVHIVRSTVTASGTTVGLTGLYHRQLHGTGQGTVEGPINWIPIADIAIAVVGRRSKQSVALPTGDGKTYMFDKA